MKIFTSATRTSLLLLVTTLCALVLLQIPIPEQFNAVVLVVTGYFFAIHGIDSKKVDKSLPTSGKQEDNTGSVGS